MKLPRLYPILDTASLEKRAFPMVEAAEAMIEGGAGILQFRHKGFYSRRVFDEARQVGELCRQFGALWVVNDRADIAKMIEAGLHLGQEDLPPEAARRIMGAGAIIGLSTHNTEQIRVARVEPVDYLALGPVFATGSKERPDPLVGVEGVRKWRKLTDRPLVAIGGITRENAADVLAAGADSVAVIGDLLPEFCTRESLRRRMKEWQQLTGK